MTIWDLINPGVVFALGVGVGRALDRWPEWRDRFAMHMRWRRTRRNGRRADVMPAPQHWNCRCTILPCKCTCQGGCEQPEDWQLRANDCPIHGLEDEE